MTHKTSKEHRQQPPSHLEARTSQSKNDICAYTHALLQQTEYKAITYACMNLMMVMRYLTQKMLNTAILAVRATITE